MVKLCKDCVSYRQHLLSILWGRIGGSLLFRRCLLGRATVIQGCRTNARKRYTLGPCTDLISRPRPGPQIWFDAKARPGPVAVLQTGPGPSAKWFMRPGPGPQNVCPGPARPGPQNNFIFEAQARLEPAGHGPGHWPDHIGPQKNSNIIIVYTL